MEAFIQCEIEQGVMTLTLNRPDRLNSFNDVMHQQLSDCLKQAERDDTIRCLLITGAGRGFCAGQDLNDRNVDPSGPAPDLGMSVERFYNPLVRRLAALPRSPPRCTTPMADLLGASSAPPSTPRALRLSLHPSLSHPPGTPGAAPACSRRLLARQPQPCLLWTRLFCNVFQSSQVGR